MLGNRQDRIQQGTNVGSFLGLWVQCRRGNGPVEERRSPLGVPTRCGLDPGLCADQGPHGVLCLGSGTVSDQHGPGPAPLPPVPLGPAGPGGLAPHHPPAQRSGAAGPISRPRNGRLRSLCRFHRTNPLYPQQSCFTWDSGEVEEEKVPLVFLFFAQMFRRTDVQTAPPPPPPPPRWLSPTQAAMLRG